MPFDPAVIRASFAVVERRADHLVTYFYAHLFAHNPDVRPLFPAELSEQRERLLIGPTVGDAVLDPHSSRPLLAVAGGTGWAQIESLMEQRAAWAGPARPAPATVFLAARDDADQYDLDTVRELVAGRSWLEVVLAAPADGAEREEAIRLLHDGLRRYGLDRYGGWAGHDIRLSGPPDLAPGVARLLLGLAADPGLIRHDPVPPTFNRTRPLTSSDWFLDRRNVPWINRTDLG
ncbi:globin domain-containing protein [Saccharothrix sp. ST-888]|uniref:globin domain-containing protein n=1 Tax=Saccharothrix sp. ST-888 TaxID=1427391 RepID=UPI0005ED3718|nr:globin domain-containing protein [Saccharothrix sp. ST-888]KJK57122.1 hypothetical protein UK12_18300 [Saccharothrix sp. ST-888]